MRGKVENDPGQHAFRRAHETLTASFTLTMHRPGISRTVMRDAKMLSKQKVNKRDKLF